MIDFNRKPLPPRREHPDDLLIHEARMAASSDWEVEFVDSVERDRTKYGIGFELSPVRREKLMQIAGEEELGDGFDR